MVDSSASGTPYLVERIIGNSSFGASVSTTGISGVNWISDSGISTAIGSAIGIGAGIGADPGAIRAA